MLGSKECATRPTSAWFLVPSFTILFLQYNMGFLVTETYSVSLEIFSNQIMAWNIWFTLSCLLSFYLLTFWDRTLLCVSDWSQTCGPHTFEYEKCRFGPPHLPIIFVQLDNLLFESDTFHYTYICICVRINVHVHTWICVCNLLNHLFQLPEIALFGEKSLSFGFYWLLTWQWCHTV